MARESNSTAIAIAVGMIVLVTAYVGSYFALVEKKLEGPGWHRLEPVAAYRYIDCSLVRAAYFPVHAIDRRVRPDAWTMEVIFF